MHGQAAESAATSVTMIAGIQGDAGPNIQAMLGAIARTRQGRGVRVAGLIEEHTEGLRKACGGSLLRNLACGSSYQLYQDLGEHSTACCLDASGVAEACQAILDQIPGADLVVLSKFGKLEAEHAGLIDAFICAAEHRRPVLTSVAPQFVPIYLEFVGPMGEIMTADKSTIETWTDERLALCIK